MTKMIIQNPTPAQRYKIKRDALEAQHDREIHRIMNENLSVADYAEQYNAEMRRHNHAVNELAIRGK